MANSESEDFESADEEISKCSGDRGNGERRTRLKESLSSVKSPSLPLSEIVEGSSKFPIELPSDNSKNVSQSPVGLSTESLGAKPKVYHGNIRKCNAKDIAQGQNGNSENSVASASRKEDFRSSRKPGPLKLGVRIRKSPTDSDDQSIHANKLKESKVRVTWSGDVKDACDEGLPVQHLTDKLSSVYVDQIQVNREEEMNSAKPCTVEHSSGWGSWGTWSMSTILSGASTVTNHVTQSLSTVTSAIETGLGAVGPEEMAQLNVEEKKTSSVTNNFDGELPEPQCSEASSSGLLSMGNVFRFMESTGGMIVASGLNTLETIGKKTMDVLQEGDPGLKKKRAFLSREAEKPSLSQVLKEARLKADIEDRERAKLKKASKAHFETLFDDYRGMVHLEALEMLSHTCQMKLESKLVQLSGPQLIDFQRTLAHIKELCELPDEDDDDEEEDRGSVEILERDLAASMRGLMVSVPHAKLIKISEDADSWLNTTKCLSEDEGPTENEEWFDEEEVPEESSPCRSLQDIHQQAIRALAQFTAAVTEHFHKTAELVLLKEEHNSAVEAHCLVMMTTILCSRVSSVAARFSELLSASANTISGVHINHNDVNSLITNVFLEASNSSSYIQDASNLLIPVLQLGAVQ